MEPYFVKPMGGDKVRVAGCRIGKKKESGPWGTELQNEQKNTFPLKNFRRLNVYG